MNATFRTSCLATTFLLAATCLFAQKATLNELLTRADRQYELNSYNLAMQTYEEALKQDKSNAHALSRIGDCHFQLHRPEQAVEWYKKALNTYNMPPDLPLRLGKVLMQLGKYDEAKDQFMLYAENEEKIGRHYANVADYAIKNAKKDSQWQIKNEAINTSAADYGPAFYYSRVVFNSARTDMMPANKQSSDASAASSNYLYVSQRNPESELLQKPSFLRNDVQNNRNEGPVSFSANGRRVAFARNKFINGTRQITETGTNMSIYTADVENGVWKNIKAFPHNGNYATGFPCLSPDGNQLLFASTQPGGFGGWDIYVSNWTASGWSEPRNLGSPLNTPGNEITPFFDGQNIYFSSDWHKGFGGMDVFRAELGGNEIADIFHLGPGVNSPRDDYGFIYNSKDNIGYLTSTRSGGRGNEDIWMVAKKWKDDSRQVAQKDKLPDNNADRYNDEQAPNEYFTPADLSDRTQPYSQTNRLYVLVTDQRGIPISDAEVDLSDCYGTKGVTGNDGRFYFDELMRTIDCSISLRKRGYRDVTLALRDFGKKDLKISLSNDNREVFRGYVFDAKSNAAVRGVTVKWQLADGEMETTTDEAGFYTLNLEPGLTYLVTYSKYGYADKVVRTNLPFNSNNHIADVLLTKIEDTRRNDDYVTYPSPARPTEHNNQAGTTTIFRREPEPEKKQIPVGPECNGYSVQLAAMPDEPNDTKLRQYEILAKLGNIYVKKEGRNNKIRLGIFKTEAEALGNLRNIQKNGAYRDAFVVQECGADKTLVIGSAPPAPVAHNADLASKGNVGIRYGIQLGSFTQNRSIKISDYTRLNGMGNLYSKNENGYTKVRLGVWTNYAEAEAVKAEVIRKGFLDATIVTERGDDPEIQDYVITGPASPPTTEAQPAAPVVYNTMPGTTNPYYVRIATLSRPDQFDAAPLEGLGTIEKRKSPNAPDMTIILLGTYPDQSTAAQMAAKLVSMGYPEAYVVKDEKGKLVRK